jgi:hypothetical protein
MVSLEVLGYVIAAILAIQRSLALCAVGVVAVVRAPREDIAAVVRALVAGGATEVHGSQANH